MDGRAEQHKYFDRQLWRSTDTACSQTRINLSLDPKDATTKFSRRREAIALDSPIKRHPIVEDATLDEVPIRDVVGALHLNLTICIGFENPTVFLNPVRKIGLPRHAVLTNILSDGPGTARIPVINREDELAYFFAGIEVHPHSGHAVTLRSTVTGAPILNGTGSNTKQIGNFSRREEPPTFRLVLCQLCRGCKRSCPRPIGMRLTGP